MSRKSPNQLDAVDDAIRRKFGSHGFRGQLNYDRAKVIETDRWWYVPCGWIGSGGCIVNKADLYVNWLGSAVSRELCLWGHEHGLFHDIVDFAFAPDTDKELVCKLVLRFKHTKPNAAGLLPKESVWYRDAEIAPVVETDFPIFRRHFVWFAIPEIHHAYENQSLRFTSTLASG